jgi:DnaK suppressor protein
MATSSLALAPLERLRLREELQDRWRDQVRRITELSLDLHSAFERDEDRNIDPAAVAIALSESRLRLGDIEEAMRRLDDHSYGSCLACSAPVAYPELMAEPERRYCGECDRSASSIRSTAAAHAG